MLVRHAFNYDRDAASIATGLTCPEPTRTKQEFKEESDINTLLRRFSITGELPTGVRMPTYGDFDMVLDFQGAANAIAQANEAFEQMPAEVRRRFDNDPEKFVAFCSDRENLAEARKLGLVPPEELPPKEAPAGGPPEPETPPDPA